MMAPINICIIIAMKYHNYAYAGQRQKLKTKPLCVFFFTGTTGFYLFN